MNLSTFDKRLKAIEQKLHPVRIKVFRSTDYNTLEQYRGAIDQYEQLHPQDHVIAVIREENPCVLQ